MRNDLTEAMADELRSAEFPGFKAATVGITDQPGCVRNQDHALSVVEDLDVEIALALQLRLYGFLFSDVENQPAVLNGFAARIFHGKRILQRMHERAVFAAQSFFE